MYKTISHNSLQYTILPQQDEGRTGPAVVHSKNGGAPRTGGTRKKSILAYIGLFFVCAIITFAILIPLMVTNDLMPTPTAWFYRNQKVLKGPLGKVSAENHILKGTPLRTSTSVTAMKTTPTTTTTSTTTEGPSAKQEHRESDDLSVTEFQNLYKSDESMERLDEYVQTTGRPTQDQPTTPEMKNLLLARTRQRTLTTTSTARATTQQSVKNYPKHFSLQKHEIAPEQETKSIQVDTNREDMEKAHQNWLQAHWSYVDPYLQWRVRLSSSGVEDLVLIFN